MTHDAERIWDVLFEDALNAPRTPDLLRRIHAREQAAHPLLEEAPAIAKAPQGRRWPRRLRMWAEGAVVTLAIGLIVWVLVGRVDKAPEEGSKAASGFAAAPGARFEKKDGFIIPQEGWFVLSTGAPEIRAEGCTISGVSGLVVFKTGAAPSAAEWNEKTDWLRQLKLETEMLGKTKSWIVAGVLALAVLQGQAIVNGEEVRAPEESNTAPIVVTSISDIEALPKGTTAVIGRNLKDSHLDFLSRVKTLQWLKLEVCQDVTDTGAGYLAQLDALQTLDVATCLQFSENGLDRLCSIPKLANLTVNAKVLIRSYAFSIKGETGKKITEKLNSLQALEIRGGSNCQDDAAVSRLVAWLPNTTSISFNGNEKLSDTSLKYVASLKRLHALDLSQCKGFTDAGMAYLRDCASLEKLDLSVLSLGSPDSGLPGAVLAQVAKLPAVTDLALDGWDLTYDETRLTPLTLNPKLKRLQAHAMFSAESLGDIGKITTLQELDLTNATVDGSESEAIAAVKSWSSLAELRVLDLSGMTWRSGALLQALPLLPKLEVLRLRIMIAGGAGAIDDAVVTRIAQITTLRELDLNQFVPRKDFAMSSFLKLKSLVNLRALKLSYARPLETDQKTSFENIMAELGKALPQCNIDTTPVE